MTRGPNQLIRIAMSPPLIVLGLTILAASIRLTLAAGSGLWADEAAFLFIVGSRSWDDLIEFLRLHESHPPFFYVVMRVWLSLAGSSDWAALTVPVVFGVALVPAVYLVGKSFFSTRTGLIAAGLVAISPALSEYSVLVRPYSLLPLLSLLSSFSLISGIERGRWKPWLAYTFSVVAMLYTHNWTWLVLAGHWVVFLVIAATTGGRERARIIRGWSCAQAAIMISYLPWAQWLLYQTQNAGHAPQTLGSPSDVLAFVLLGIRTFLQSTVLGYVPLGDPAVVADASRVFAILLVMLVSAGLWLRSRWSRFGPVCCSKAYDCGRTELTILLGAPLIALLLALLLSTRSSMLLARCLVILAPSLILALACWLGRPRKKPLRPILIGAVAAVLASHGAGLYALNLSPRSNARELAAAVAARTTATDVVIIVPEWHAASFNRYYRPSVEQIDFPHFRRIGAVDYQKIRARTADPGALARVRSRITALRRDGRRVWLVTPAFAAMNQSALSVSRNLTSSSYVNVGLARASQIHGALIVEYGRPDTILLPHRYVPISEYLQAMLFTPDMRHVLPPQGR